MLTCCIIYVFVMGASPAHHNDSVGRMHTFLSQTLWTHYLNRFLVMIIGRRGVDWCQATADWFINKPNPVVQLFYLTLLTGGGLIVFISGWPLMDILPYSQAHKLLMPLMFMWTYLSFYLACSTNPGRVTQRNLFKAVRVYPFDNVLYHDKPAIKQCSTCKLDRPARSKHCSVCNMCVMRMDHHCIWINNCVGYRNHRWFIMFLISTSMLCLYAGYMIYLMLNAEIDRQGIMKMFYWNELGEQVPVSRYIAHIVYHHRKLYHQF